MAESLQQYLQQQRAQGKLDSSGRFTLNLARANELLARYQLENNGFYLLKMVQGAVAGRATLVKIALDRSRVELSIYGPNLKDFFSRDVVQALLAPEEAMRLDTAPAHLAIGLNAALNLQPETLSWQTWGPHCRETLQVTRSGCQVQPLRERPWKQNLPGYRFQLNTLPPPPPPESSREGLLSRLFPASRPPAPVCREHQEVSRRCLFSPATVFLDGRRVDRPFLGREGEGVGGVSRAWRHLAERFILAQNPAADRFAAPPLESRQACCFEGARHHLLGPDWGTRYLEWIRETPGGSHRRLVPDIHRTRCSAMLAIPEEQDGPSQVTFVKQGVTLDTRTVDLGPRRVLAVCSAQGLATDLSQTQVVENPNFHYRVKVLREHAAQLFEAASAY